MGAVAPKTGTPRRVNECIGRGTPLAGVITNARRGCAGAFQGGSARSLRTPEDLGKAARGRARRHGRGAAVTMGGPPSTSDRLRSSMYETFGPKMLSARYERAQVWGLDCADVLRWKMWEPGGTYVRSLVLKNVSTKALKLKYKLPRTKYFEMEFPETIKLSPGMSVPVDVTFRPIKREQYDDFIEFKVAGCGTFKVKVIAALPTLSLDVRASSPPRKE